METTLETLRAAIEALPARTAELVLAALEKGSTTEILNRVEAMTYVKRRSEGAFSTWCRAYRVKPYHRGRYSRAQLDIALRFEARRRG